MRISVDEQSNQGNSVETHCRFCGYDSAEEPDSQSKAPRDQYQVVVACAECGNDFASISRN
jgi:DNA-directed RNA polymerase subunit M/transcription elongation factor TFIIS